MKKIKVVCFGEALIDRIRNKSNQESTDFLGGAPANVACALRKLKINSVFIGRLGSDEFGERFINQFKQLKVDINFLQTDDNLPTRIVRVDRDDSGDRYFSGFEKNVEYLFADEAINKEFFEKNLESLEHLFSETQFLVTGTNVLSSKMSAESIHYILGIASKFNVKIVIDLNWREVFWDYSTFTSETSKKVRSNLIRDFLNFAHILKLAKEEALLFFDEENPYKISTKFLNRPDVIVTDGGNPIKWFVNGFQGVTSVSNSHEIIDTTGAGDAFLSGLISKLIFSDHPSSEIETNDYIKFASICGLLTCFGEGAIEQQPDYEKVNEFLGSNTL